MGRFFLFQGRTGRVLAKKFEYWNSVFGEHEESHPFQGECASYELLPDAPPSVDQFAYWLHTQGAVVHSLSPCQSSQVRSIGVRH